MFSLTARQGKGYFLRNKVILCLTTLEALAIHHKTIHFTLIYFHLQSLLTALFLHSFQPRVLLL